MVAEPMTRPHSTHHDDCGCLSERHAQQIADANAAIKRLTRELDEAIHAAAEGNGCAQALERQLAASQAECAALRVLGQALRREIDGVPNEGFDHQRSGRIQSKTMALLAALSRPPGSRGALRAMLREAWQAGYLRGCGGCNPADGPPWDDAGSVGARGGRPPESSARRTRRRDAAGRA